MVVVFGVVAASVSAVSPISAVVPVPAAASVSRVAVGSPSDHAGHLLPDVLGLDALLLEQLLVAEQRDHGLGPLAD